jgi:hypothetical protein
MVYGIPKFHKWVTITRVCVYVCTVQFHPDPAAARKLQFHPDPPAARKLSTHLTCKHKIVLYRQNLSHFIEFFIVLTFM